MSPSACAKIIYWRTKPSQFDVCTDYLRTEVEPIDHAALQQGMLTGFATLMDTRAPMRRPAPRGRSRPPACVTRWEKMTWICSAQARDGTRYPTPKGVCGPWACKDLARGSHTVA